MVRRSFKIIETADRGRGIAARRPLRDGQLVMQITGQVIDDPSYHSRYCIDLGKGRALEPDPPGALLNHSCQPNCELITGGQRGDAVELRATQDISPGQELTIDYAWEAETVPYACHCGSQDCRKYIVNADQLPELLAWMREGGRTAS